MLYITQASIWTVGQICTQSVNKDPPTCPVTPHPFQSRFSLGLSGMSQFISQMHLQYGSKLLFLLKDKAHALRADVSHSLQESQTDLVCPTVIFLFPFLLFPFLKVIFTLPSYDSFFFFFCIHFSHSTLLFGPWSWSRCCWVVSSSEVPFFGEFTEWSD